ncbi:hypothetical protein GCM10010309_63420 [Streptomyces violaceochromogenes]|nr:hypothetical protein GCM10010309_63420 [Streptomyces violaceochromogenes]
MQVRLSPVIARAILGTSPAGASTAPSCRSVTCGAGRRPGSASNSGRSPWQDRFAWTDVLLARRHEAGPPVDPDVVWAWHRIVVSRGLIRVDGLAAEVGWSRKRLWSRFRSQLGLPPKRREAGPLRPCRPPPGRG